MTQIFEDGQPLVCKPSFVAIVRVDFGNLALMSDALPPNGIV